MPACPANNQQQHNQQRQQQQQQQQQPAHHGHGSERPDWSQDWSRDWNREQEALMRRVGKVVRAKERSGRAQQQQPEPITDRAETTPKKKSLIEIEWVFSLFQLILHSLLQVLRVPLRLLCCKISLIVGLFLIAVASVSTFFWRIWTVTIGAIPGTQAIPQMVSRILPMLPGGGPRQDDAAAAAALSLFDMSHTVATLCPHTNDMNSGIGYLSNQIHHDQVESGIAASIVDEVLRRNGLIADAATPDDDGDPSLATTAAPPPPPHMDLALTLDGFLIKISSEVRDMGEWDRSFRALAEEGLFNSYYEAKPLLPRPADKSGDGGAAKSSSTTASAFFFPLSLPWSFDVDWDKHRDTLDCWWSGQIEESRKLHRRVARFQKILAEAVLATPKMVSIFKGGDSGTGSMDIAAEKVLIDLCRLDNQLVEAVRVGSQKVTQAQRQAIIDDMGSKQTKNNDNNNNNNNNNNGGLWTTSEQTSGQLVKSDVKLLEAARREVRRMQAVGSALCLQAKQTEAGVDAQREMVFDLRDRLLDLQQKLANRQRFMEEPVRFDPCSKKDVSAEDRKLTALVQQFLKLFENAYMV